MMEYNIKRTYEPRSLDEVVGESVITGQKMEKDYESLANYVKINVPYFVTGILIGSAPSILNEILIKYLK
ncbi:MAG TPA: hypothetical protein VJI32_03360 [Candidatus Nanoarchaeia archaeon]|nr:hypothetical protein [Candidatus Nanoarchaeia archaeon]